MLGLFYNQKGYKMNISTTPETIDQDDVMFEGDTWLSERDF
jgi:hypothetical protein